MIPGCRVIDDRWRRVLQYVPRCGRPSRMTLRARCARLVKVVSWGPDAQASLFDMVRLRDELSRMFGRKVDLATPAILENPFRRRSILEDLRELYAV